MAGDCDVQLECNPWWGITAPSLALQDKDKARETVHGRTTPVQEFRNLVSNWFSQLMMFCLHTDDLRTRSESQLSAFLYTAGALMLPQFC